MDPWTTNGHHQNGASASEAGSVLAEADLPEIYHQSYRKSADPKNGLVSQSSLENLLIAHAGLTSASTEKILNIVGQGQRIGKGEFCAALVLAAFAQQYQELSLKNISNHVNNLPIPTLYLEDDSDPLSPGTSPALATKVAIPAPLSNKNNTNNINNNNTSSSSPTPTSGLLNNDRSSFSDPWIMNNSSSPTSSSFAPAPATSSSDDPASSFYSSAPALQNLDEEARQWDMPTSSDQSEQIQETIKVFLEDQLEGKWLGRYQPYRVESDRRDTTVMRRYSDFVWLLDCLSQRYPFRNLPFLPPKRASIAAVHLVSDDGFLERRRRGLQRFMNSIVRHPVFRIDNLVNTFLTEKTELSLWKKSANINLIEEHVNRQLTPVEEMSVPSDLEEKLGQFKSRIGRLVEHWSRLCTTLERMVRRQEAQAADLMRLNLGLKATVDLERNGWRSTECEITESNTERMAERLRVLSEQVNQRSANFSVGTVEQVKMQRDALVSFRELFLRQAKLSPDSVEKLKKNIDQLQSKIDSTRETRRENWETEVRKLESMIETNQLTIESLLRRRVFIRFAMWQELQTLFRGSTFLTPVYKKFTHDEHAFVSKLQDDWNALGESLEAL